MVFVSVVVLFGVCAYVDVRIDVRRRKGECVRVCFHSASVSVKCVCLCFCFCLGCCSCVFTLT